MAEEFSFARPLEAPTFHPTEEEFADPLGYISKIRPTAERYGICKIKPPAYWAPPFAVDVDKFKFIPRIQKINELEAITRIKLNFLDQISKFWELQGTSLRIPVFGHKALDLYTLHGLVHSNDFKNSKLNEEKKWNRIATRMGLQSNGKMSVGNQLKAHYDKILYPYDVWKSNQGKKKTDSPRKTTATTVKSRMKGRMGGPKPKSIDPVRETPHRNTLLANYICQVCNGGDVEEKMLLCDGCDDSYHTFCLKPPLDDIPKGEWRCPDCLEEKLSRPNDGFGFEQATREYTLQQFGEMADTFKSEYFNMPVHLVSTKMVEKEFWRIVSAIDEDVIVEYGADLHTMDHGSGFPTVSNSVSDSDEMYINSGWNLNKLPVLKGSVFAHINADISGMKVPWMYVGMCFSTFCWHNEDHWSYSINYLHWGEPKTWYGVPGKSADEFENTMKSAATELFAQAPDLLHQLVTIMNPNILMKGGVPVYRMDQKAGEFIITFPRAYHAGFNQGYNFAEAVNFAPADWLQMGRDCVMHYSNLNRFCVFSHDELVCAMAATPNKLDFLIALATYKDMTTLFESEKQLRQKVADWGIKATERCEFEHLIDDGRQCFVCKTTLFLSAVACIHSKGSPSKDASKLVCLKHYDKYGCKDCKKDPSKHIMKYRFNLDELPDMIKSLKARTGKYEEWVQKMRKGLSSNFEDKHFTLDQLREMIEEAQQFEFPPTELLETAQKLYNEAEKASKIAKALIGTVRTRKAGSSDMKYKCNYEELKLLSQEMTYLLVEVPERPYINNLYQRATELRTKTLQYLERDNVSIDDMALCIEESFTLDVEMEEILKLRNKFSREKWLRLANSDSDEGSVWTLDYLRKIIEDGNEVHRNNVAEKRLEELMELYQKALCWENSAAKILTTKEKHPISSVEALINQSEEISVALPSLPQLRELITKANNWLEKVNTLNPNSFLDDFISAKDMGECLPIEFEQMKALTSQLDFISVWRENCMKVFLKRNSTIELMEALVPRRDIPKIPHRGKKKRLLCDGPSLTFMANLLGIPPPDVKSDENIRDAYKRNIVVEFNSMKALRKINKEKLNAAANEEESLFCVCQKPKEGFMIRCELCFEWYHPTCVPLPKITESTEDSNTVPSQAVTAYRIACRETKFLGPCCSRSRRPTYSIILQLLQKLRQNRLVMVEAVALECLTHRAVKWEDEYVKLKENPALKNVLEMVKCNSSSVITGPATPATNVTVKVEVETDDLNKEVVSDPPKKIFFSSSINGQTSPDSNRSPTRLPQSEAEIEVALCLAGMRERSPLPQNVEAQAPTGTQDSPVPQIKLNDEILQQIENLLIEADLMELSIEESDWLWKIYDLSNPTIIETRDFKEIQRLIQEEISSKGLTSWESHQQQKPRKRRSISGSEDSQLQRSPKKRKLSGDNVKRLKSENQECDEDCAAVRCRQPTGKEVNWIQCDVCDQWFHLSCVGLKKSQVKNLEKYTCGKCSGKNETGGIVPLDVEDCSSCDTDSKLSSSGKLSISSNKENTNGGGDRIDGLKDDSDGHESTTNTSVNVFSKVN